MLLAHFLTEILKVKIKTFGKKINIFTPVYENPMLLVLILFLPE